MNTTRHASQHNKCDKIRREAERRLVAEKVREEQKRRRKSKPA